MKSSPLLRYAVKINPQADSIYLIRTSSVAPSLLSASIPAEVWIDLRLLVQLVLLPEEYVHLLEEHIRAS
jgi:hypothetical protein